MYSKRLIALGGTMLLGLVGVTQAEPTQAQLQSKVATLEARLAQLEGQQNANWLNERRAEEVKALVREVLSDADTRASLLSNAMTAGHNGKNFFLASEDGTFLMNIGGEIQFRYIANFRDAANPNHLAPIADDNRQGFQLARTGLNFSGFIGTPKLEYYVSVNANSNDNSVFLEEAKIGYTICQCFEGPLKVVGGRYTAPLLREEIVSQTMQLAVERSSFAAMFGAGRAEGAGLEWTGKMVKAGLMVNDGVHSGDPVPSAFALPGMFGFPIPINGNDFQNTLADFAVTGRVDVKLSGEWAQMDDFQAWEGEPTGIFLGAGVHYQTTQSGNNGFALALPPSANPNFAVTDFVTWVLDGAVEYQGFSFYAAFAGTHINGNDDLAGLAPTLAANHYGAMAQASYMLVADKFEPFVRYEWLNTDFRAVGAPLGPGADVDTNLITFGANYYIKKHQAKLTMDVVLAFDPLSARSAVLGGGLTSGTTASAGLNSAGVSSSRGLLGDGASRDTQIAVRVQFQLLF